MFRTSRQMFLIGIILVGMGAAVASEAEAGWWWGCCRPTCSVLSPCCYTPSYAYSSSPYCSSPGCGWTLGWRPGPVRRLLFGPYRWYPAACCPVCRLDDCCCADSGVTVSVSRPTLAEQYEPTPAKKPAPAPAPAPSPAPVLPADPAPKPGPATGTPNAPVPPSAASSTRLPDGTGKITLVVPADAEVIINGLKTTARGNRRVYMSHNLKPGFAYDYEVTIRLNRNGEVLERVRNIRMTDGAQRALAVDFGPRPDRLAQK